MRNKDEDEDEYEEAVCAAACLPGGLVASEVGERALEVLVDLVQRELLLRRAQDRLQHIKYSRE